MSPDQWRRVADIFAKATKTLRADRQWLEEACAGDEEILREVEKLLRAQKDAGDFLERPLVHMADDTKTSLAADNKPTLPDFGAYHILGVLGEGGMAMVYLAEQRGPIQRRVALKVVKRMDDQSLFAARFESERQALALMDHPNIAKVFDAGTTGNGTPYLAMEYVPGIPLTDYADRNLLGLRERLLLFQDVCQAVQHAHQKGIIHRDLKPSNVLVTMNDGKPVPKVIDFGIAKALNQRLTERTIFTEVGMLIGTPEYMSPEQADADGLNVDTRTDVYSLGVLLYELLVGALPLDRQALRKAGYAEIMRMIREVDPPVPSMRLSTLGDSASEVARHRRTDLRTLAHLLKGDLEWITMKALDKDRGRRYASASEFAADIGRHLANEPVSAGPPGLAYRGRKFVSRHRGSVLAAASVVLALCTGAIVSFSQYLSATREKSVAEIAGYSASLSAAELLLRAGQAGDARSRLANTPPGLRGWEWRHLMSRTDQSIATIYSGILFGSGYHMMYPELRFSEDAAQIITYGGNSVRSWDTATKLLVTDQSGTERVLAVGPYGKTMLAGPQLDTFADLPPEGFELHLYDVATRKLIARFQGMAKNPGAAAISDDGALAAAVLDPLTQPPDNLPSPILVWDTRNGKLIARLEGHTNYVATLKFSPDGKLLLSGSSASDRTARMWDLASGRNLYVLQHDGGVYGVAFSRDGRRFVTGCNSTVRIWDTATGRLIKSWDSGLGYVNAVALSPDDTLVATASSGNVRLWDTITGVLRADFRGMAGVTALAFHPGNTRLFAWDGSVVKEFDLRRRNTLDEARDFVLAVTASPDGRYVAAGSADHDIRIYEADSGRLIRSLTGHTGQVGAVAFSPDSLLLASGSADRTVRLWSVADGRLIRTLTGHTDRVVTLSFYPTGQQIASGSQDQTVRVWNVTTGSQTASMSEGARLCAVAVHPDGKTLAMLDEYGSELSIWNAETYQRAGTLETGTMNEGTPCSGMAFSGDGEFLVGPANNAQGIAIWDYRRRRLEKVLPVFRVGEAVKSVAISPDKALVAVGGYVQGTLSLWDIRRGTLLANLGGHTLRVHSLAWAPDGSALFSGSFDRTVRVWDSRSSHDYEAELLVESASEGLLLADEIVERLKRQPGISVDLLRRATDLAIRRGDSYYGELELAAWKTGRSDDRSSDEYARAYRRAMAAAKAAPWYSYGQETLGLLEYRVGKYIQAIASARRAMEMRKKNAPDAHAVCGLAYYRLKDPANARAEVVAGRREANRLFPGDKDQLLDQAEALILGRAGAIRR